MKLFFAILPFFLAPDVFGQIQKIEFGKEYTNVKLDTSSGLKYQMHFEKGGVYQVVVLQQGIDVVLALTDKNGSKILEKDSPNGKNGDEKFEYTPTSTSDFFLTINNINAESDTDAGKLTVKVVRFSKSQLLTRAKIRKDLEPENKRNVQTLDIAHFWETFDSLKICKTHSDSVSAFQRLYLDRATDGLLDFIEVRNFTAEKFVTAVSRLPKFYSSIRQNTEYVKKAEPLIEQIFEKFQEIYPNFKPFKVCFAIGLVNTGGTVSNNFVLIGSEITASTKDADLSEFKNLAFTKVLASEGDIVQKLKNIVAHECVHTQQKDTADSTAIRCNLLFSIMREGFCDFIGELVAGSQINKVAVAYGETHEKEIWEDFKSELCNESTENWLYNYSTVKDKPGDLGYYVGYKIAKAYYEKAADKKQAVVDIIEMQNPLRFLELSGYDRAGKK